MLIIPAIDLKDAQCVSGRQGSIDDATVFSSNPVAQAREWVARGARRLHLVDLDGAGEGEPKNGHVIRAIAHEFPGVPVQVGGGVRNMKTVASYIEARVDYVVLGSAALHDHSFLGEACRRYRGHIMAALDVRNGHLVSEAWSEESDVTPEELIELLNDLGVAGIVYTDVERDGMMQGVNVDEAVRLAALSRAPLFVSGGIGSLEHIGELYDRHAENVQGVIVGRALYEQRVDLARARHLYDPL